MSKFVIAMTIIICLCPSFLMAESKVDLRTALAKMICERYIDQKCILHPNVPEFVPWPKDAVGCEKVVMGTQVTLTNEISNKNYDRCLDEVRNFKKNEVIDCLWLRMLIEDSEYCQLYPH